MDLVGVIDQGTSSSRFVLFQANKVKPVAFHQIELQRLSPESGWSEIDPQALLATVLKCIEATVDKLEDQLGPGAALANIKCVGIANQRETVVAWDFETGEPLYNAILWLDARTTKYVDEILQTQPEQLKLLKDRSGLRISNYFSALKIKWLMKNVEKVQQALHNGTCRFGTIDSWLIWNLTGGPKAGIFVTDVSNASRTMLMNIKTLEWDPVLSNFFEIPISTLAQIRSSSEIYGHIQIASKLQSVPISSCLGDQQAALIGHKSFKPGDAKCTFGTGCFLLINTGNQLISDCEGLLSTVAYKLGPSAPAVYALEGSAGMAGAAMRWLKESMTVAESYTALSELAASINDTEGVYFVPAFTGLFAPHWRPDARATICGMSTTTTKAHIARAAYEATAYQVEDVLQAMKSASNMSLDALKVDGGMTASLTFIQILSEVFGIPVLRPLMSEATALGAAMAAGYAEGIKVWDIYAEGEEASLPYERFQSQIADPERQNKYLGWQRAVKKSLDS